MVRHARYVTFQMAEVLVSKSLFYEILARLSQMRKKTTVPFLSSMILVLASAMGAYGAIPGTAVYIMDDISSDTIPDHSAAAVSNDMVIAGGATTSTDVPFPDTNNLSLLLDGLDDRATLKTTPTPSLLGAGKSLTFEMWIKPTTIGSEHSLWTFYRDTHGGDYFHVRINGSKLQAYSHSPTWELQATGAATIQAGVWTHVAAVFEENIGIHLYVNGLPDGDDLGSGSIGASVWESSIVCNTDWPYHGLIDEIQIWDEALDASAIWYHYNHHLQEGAELECGAPGTVYLEADLNKNCEVDVNDLMIFVAQWQWCSDPAEANCDKYWD